MKTTLYSVLAIGVCLITALTGPGVRGQSDISDNSIGNPGMSPEEARNYISSLISHLPHNNGSITPTPEVLQQAASVGVPNLLKIEDMAQAELRRSSTTPNFQAIYLQTIAMQTISKQAKEEDIPALVEAAAQENPNHLYYLSKWMGNDQVIAFLTKKMDEFGSAGSQAADQDKDKATSGDSALSRSLVDTSERPKDDSKEGASKKDDEYTRIDKQNYIRNMIDMVVNSKNPVLLAKLTSIIQDAAKNSGKYSADMISTFYLTVQRFPALEDSIPDALEAYQAKMEAAENGKSNESISTYSLVMETLGVAQHKPKLLAQGRFRDLLLKLSATYKDNTLVKKTATCLGAYAGDADCFQSVVETYRKAAAVGTKEALDNAAEEKVFLKSVIYNGEGDPLACIVEGAKDAAFDPNQGQWTVPAVTRN